MYGVCGKEWHNGSSTLHIGEYKYRDIIIPDGIPAIVPKDLCDRVQIRMEKNRRAPARHKAENDYLLNAIQQVILTRSTKTRLDELEEARDEAESRIACEKMSSPRISEEFMRFWLYRFRKLDVRQQDHRKMLIDPFINTIYLYDDKIVITFNYKEGTKTVFFDDVKESLSGERSSDLDASAVPLKTVELE